MKKRLSVLIWIAVALLGAGTLAGVALARGETINSAWLVLAAVCTYLAAYRFYAAFIAANVLALDDNRATPAERLRNGKTINFSATDFTLDKNVTTLFLVYDGGTWRV
jgi:carbon starvation protein